MPIPPPTRPHSAAPHFALNSPTSLFNPSTTSLSSSSSSRPRHPQRNPSMSSAREAEWEDAWDSSSDRDEEEDQDGGVSPISPRHSPSKSYGVDIPRGPRAGEEESGNKAAGGTTSSWSSSYQHVSKLAAGSPERPILQQAKTYTDASTAPPPGTTAVLGDRGGGGGGIGLGHSKLPPGGAWEVIEVAEIAVPAEDESSPPRKSGKEAVRDDVDDVLRDPLQLLSNLSISQPSTPTPASQPASSSSTFPFLTPTQPSTPTSSTTPTTAATTDTMTRTPSRGLGRQRSVRTERRREKFARVLKGRAEEGGGVDPGELRRLAWSGIPPEVRPIAWQLLLNYLPLATQPRLATLSRKRREYTQLVDQYFSRGLASLDQQIWHQIEIDVPRTRPGVPLWSGVTAQRALERILYVWAIRHPASGYVQGINDLVCPFFQVFLSAYIDAEADPESFDVAHLPPSALSAIEADTFWCLSKLLDGIQDNYISHQPGIQRLVKRMGELVKRIDAPLAMHFADQGVEFMQFAFRWMNCLLMREISVKCTIRMWDTYLAEGTNAFSQFHLYVCSALLVKFSERLREMDFQEMIIFLQCLPTQSWTDHDVELLLSEAYVLKTVWQGAENHFANLPNGQGGGFGMLGR